MSRPTQLPPAGAPDVLYLVDLSGYVFRAYHALPPLSNSKGEPTHATYGTVSMLVKLVEERKPAYLGIAMDSPGRTFRDDIDARYKAHRPPPPPDLSRQMARCKEIVEAYRIPIFSAEGVEADDCIAVAVARAKQAGLRVVIAASDKDLMQLVDDDRVILWDAMRDRVYGPPEVEHKFGVGPERLRDLLALVGDSTDNVPGVPGIGPKTAAELLNELGTLDGIYQNLDKVKKPRIREALRQHEADARISQRLVSLDANAPCNLNLDELRYGGADVKRLRELFLELEFTRFLKAVPAPALSTDGYRTILTRVELEAVAKELAASDRVAIEVHASSREAMRAHVAGIAVGSPNTTPAYLPIGHRYLGAPAQLRFEDVREVLGPILEDETVVKVGHDVKFAEVVLARHGIALRGVRFDSMLASYLLDPEAPNDLPAVAEREAGVTMTSFETIAPRPKNKPARLLEDVEVADATRWAAQFPAVVLSVVEPLKKRLADADLETIFETVELPLSHVLARMEQVGVLVDPAALAEIGRELSAELATLEKRAREVVGRDDFNVNSPKQLETILFDELKLKVTRRTKTGRSTDAEALEAIANDHPLPAIILEHRAIAKLQSTYIEALPKLIHPETGRIHTRWSQAVAATGRLSSQDPNLQNIPIRTPLGRRIRRAFVAPKGRVLVSADYSQIELRLLAHLSHDPVLVDAFNAGQDVHARTAMEVFGVDAAGVTEEMRRKSKTINFGIIYGMGEVALAKRLGISRAEAAKFMERYFARYQGVSRFMEATMLEAKRTESVRTLLGRRRLLPDLRSSDHMKRSYAERIAQNTPIQGSAADLLKTAMVRLAEPVVPGAQMVLTVHDELVFEVPTEAAEETKAKIRSVMENVAKLDVPLVVDVGSGPTWADAH